MIHFIFLFFAFAWADQQMYQTEASRILDTVHAAMLDLKSNEFRYHMDRTSIVHAGRTLISNRYTNLEVIGASEEITYENGIPTLFIQDRPLEKIRCEVAINQKELFFTRYEDGKVVKTDKEIIEDITLVPDQIVPLIQQKWGKIMKGESIKFRLTVPCRLETVGFKVFLAEETNIHNKPVYLIKLKPKSFIIAALVPSILLYFDKNPPHPIIEYRGHVLPVRKLANGIDSFDGIIKFKINHPQ